MGYELWDAETNNRVGCYRTERAALKTVAVEVDEYGETSAEVTSLALLHRDSAGSVSVLAAGVPLAQMARAAGHGAPRRKPTPVLPSAS